MSLEKINEIFPSKEELLNVFNDYLEIYPLFTLMWKNILNTEYDTLLNREKEFSTLIWIQLNTGNWSDVNDFYRELYYLYHLYIIKISITRKDLSVDNCKAYLKKIDDALVMGKPVFDNLGTQMASIMHYYINSRDPLSIDEDESIFIYDEKHMNCHPVSEQKSVNLSIFESPSFQEFQRIVNNSLPCIIRGSINHWSAMKKWTLKYWMKELGYRTVPIEIGSSYADSNWSQSLMTISDFISKHILATESQEIGYLAQHQLFLQIPELLMDIDVPDYCYSTKSSENMSVDMNIWFGPKGTVSPLHHDGNKKNLLCQVKGCKYVKLYNSDQTEYLYAHQDKMLKNTSQMKIDCPDFVNFPLFKKAVGFHGYIEAGDMLYIPPFCWHYVESKSVSFSVNFWWQ